jgi:4-alpha-glucanotransferase
LLHPTSLPGPGSRGTLGREARRFVDFLAAAGFSVWQVLPLGPVDDTLSPYQLRSAFAGNLDLLDAGALVDQAWGTAELPGTRGAPLAAAAWAQFRAHAEESARAAFTQFRAREASWLLPYALFEVMSEAQARRPWWEWPPGWRDREPDAVRAVLQSSRPRLLAVMFGQFLFERQWQAVRSYAAERGVQIFGDLPFYVDRNSADVWWHRDCFLLDAEGQPTAVAGVPPDYFNADGQLWGNPLYDWVYLAEHGFRWWLARLAHQGRWFDLLRLDHFRALEACWAVPAGAETAREGQWQPVPGSALLSAAAERLPRLQLVAEDLGTITPAVTALRERFRLPGMLVLQFAFDGSPGNPYLPGNHVAEAVVYTGTHDNDTSAGWYASLDEPSRRYVHEVLGDGAMPELLVDAAYASPARLAVLPMQDLLGLGSEARMNSPGTVGGNWTWRFDWADVPVELAHKYRARAVEAGRGGAAAVGG